jgi:aspartate/methionine/tyrosine aminotransferase
MFSSRLPPVLAENALSQAVAAAEHRGARLLDLTETNPTAVGLSYPADLAARLAVPGADRYTPAAAGLRSAREAVAAGYAPRPHPADPDRIVLTASTSEAYALLFKLLADAGDDVLVPQPSYPLFDLLTRLEGVRAVPYQLDPDGAWSIDRASLAAALSVRTRAILVVSPNNPTGSMLNAADREWLIEVSAAHGAPLIADEVFADYPLRPRRDATSLAGTDRVLTFVLGGLSKSAGLPQMKLAWIVASGPPAAVEEALARLTLIADTYLSASTPVQLAVPGLLETGRNIREAIHARLRQNLDALDHALEPHPSIRLLPPEGGWSAVIQVPAIAPEEALAIRLVEEASVRVHPGYFFDFPREAFFVVSLLPAPGVFAEALSRALPLLAGDRG